MNPSDDDDPFTRALRLDLPEPTDEARVRARLVSAGVLAGAVVAPGAAAGAAAAGGGLVGKLVALPLALKVGASVALIGVAALPALVGLPSTRHAETSMAPTLLPSPGARALAAPKAASETLELPSPGPASTAASEPFDQAPAVAARPLAAPARALERQPGRATASSPLPAVASFATEALPLDEGSLRAETALMERALAALKRGELTTARRELTEHQARFPNGHLVRERERALERLEGKEIEHASK